MTEGELIVQLLSQVARVHQQRAVRKLDDAPGPVDGCLQVVGHLLLRVGRRREEGAQNHF